MEVRGQNPGGAGEARRRFEEAKRDAFSDNRERVQRARQALEGLAEQRSKILRQVREQTVQRQLERASAEADVAAKEARETLNRRETAGTERPSRSAPAKRDAVELSPIARANAEEADPARKERVDALKRDVSEGRLLSQERLERAAQSLLSRERE